MQKIEKFRKLCKYSQYIGMGVILIAGMALMYFFGMRNENGTNNTLSILLGTIMLLFLFMMVVGVPMQNKLVKMIIVESLNGLVEELTFNRKKGYSKESFLKLHLAPENFSNYVCQDYYSFKYKDMLVESTTIKAFDEYKVPKAKGKGKKTKMVKESKIYFFGRVYVIPFENLGKFNVFGKKHPSLSFKKEMVNRSYCNELPIKIKKYFENFEVYYKDEKPENIQSVLEKLYYLKLQAKGPVSMFVRNSHIVLCINNSRYYQEVETKHPIDESLVKDYRKDVSMVLSFINSLVKE